MDVTICLSFCTLFLAQGRYLERVNLLALATDDRQVTQEITRISQLLTQKDDADEDIVIDNSYSDKSNKDSSKKDNKVIKSLL